MIILVVNALYFRLRSLLVLVVFECYLLIIMNMSRQAKVVAQVAAVQEVAKPQVINTTIMGARRYDATTGNGDTIEGLIVLFKDSIPALIDGESKDINKKWFGVNNVIDALIMSEDDAVAARVAAVLDGDYMALRGIVAHISVYTDDEQELHYKLEF